MLSLDDARDKTAFRASGEAQLAKVISNFALQVGFRRKRRDDDGFPTHHDNRRYPTFALPQPKLADTHPYKQKARFGSAFL